MTSSTSTINDLANRAVGPDETSPLLTDIPSWGHSLLEAFRGDVSSTARPFPCTFAVTALKRNHIRFGFFDPAQPDCAERLAAALSHFAYTWGDVALRTSLVCFFRPDEEVQTLSSYCSRFWGVLQALREHDPKPWPLSIPIDPDNPEWEFCFESTPVFVVCTTPAHHHRASRWSPAMTITFQPRGVFAGLDPSAALGARSREVIRKRLSDYDTVDVAPDLQNYGEPACREWRQYFLPDTNDQPGVCPFSSTSAAPRGAPASPDSP